MIDHKVRNIVSSLSRHTEGDFFTGILSGLANAISAEFVFIAALNPDRSVAATHTVIAQGNVTDNFSYELKGTPCEVTQSGSCCVHPSNIQPQYPDDLLLVEMGIEGYVGVPLKNADDSVDHILVALYQKPVEDAHETESLFLLFSGLIQKELEKQAVIERLKLTDHIIRESHEAIMIANKQVEIVYVNKAFSDITGYTFEEVEGKNPGLLSAKKHNAEYYESLWANINTKGHWSGEILNQRKNGELFTERLTINSIFDSQGEVSHYVAFFADITEDKNKDRELFHRTHYDALTGLANRSYFHERLNQAVSRSQANDSTFFVVSMGLDRFKDVNDFFGFVVGDRVLVETGRKLKSMLRKTDILARMSGDQFVLLVEDVADQTQIQIMAEKVCQAFSQPMLIDNADINVTMSLGIAEYPNDADSVDHLLKKSEHALYNSKERGRNTYTFFTESMQEDAIKRIKLRNDLKHAIENNALDVAYQPIIHIGDNKISKFEALVRWNNQGTWISPMDFIPIAEEFGLIRTLGMQVLEKASAQLKQIHDKGYSSISFNINRSVGEFKADEACAAEWLEVIAAQGLSPSCLNFELTESVLAPDKKGYLEILERLRSEGSGISLDDFGTGYSSLSYLRRFPLDEIKIDRAFVSEMTEDEDDKTLVTTIIAMAKALGMQVVAEGIETKEQLALLNELGCDFGQGYFIAKPMPGDEIEAFLASYE